jgi:DNA-binding CsgD family transcriptional regulator
MTNALGTTAVIAQEAIHRLSVTGLAQLDLLREVATRVRSVVPYDGGAWLTTDPTTLLQTGAFIEGKEIISEQTHLRFADNELLTPDFAKITDMARGERTVVTLHEATDGDLARSARHRTIHADLGVGHELRAVFRTGETTWGAVCMCRELGQPNFSDAEKDFVARVSQYIGDGLRLALLLDTGRAERGHGIPGVIVLGADDTIESTTPEAEEWLADITRDQGADFELPSIVHNVARQARAIAGGTASGPAMSRIRLGSGLWLLVRAAQMHQGDGRAGSTAVILEPARAAELAPIIVDLYELSPRERHVTALLLRGLPIDDIAAALWISRHTVRDHTKAIFAKLAVGSRPELMAKLFHDHHLPVMDFDKRSLSA